MALEINYVSVMELLLPPFNAGLLLGGTVLFTYLAIQYKSKLYMAITLLGLTALAFVVGDVGIAFFGAWQRQMGIGTQFHRFQQTVAVYFLFSLPYLLVHLLKLNEQWRRANFIIALAGLGAAAFFTVIAYAFPELYISMAVKPFSVIPGRVTYLWDREGALYPVRDILVGLVVLYCIVCIVTDIIRHRRREVVPVFVGLLIAISGAAIDILAVWRGSYFLFPGEYFTRMSLGLTLLVLALMAGIVGDFVKLSKEVHRAHERLKLSERKNRILAQGTKDCILSLNDDYYFLNANRQAFKQLHLKGENLEKTNFLDLVHSESGSTPFLVNFIKEKLEGLKKNKETVFMKLRLKCYLPTESKSYNVAFEYVETEEGNEIIATASLPQEESCLKYVQAESGRLVIDNFLLTVEEICSRLVATVSKFTNGDGVKQIQIGLREMLLNALEHGNLGIRSEEKNRALMEDNYFQFISARQNMPEHKDKKITVEYSLSPAKAVYRITDQGKGFDCRAFLGALKTQKENMNLQGRGVFMALNIFDKISYNDRGNCVTLVKNFS